jgi:hypothetical protein
LSGIRKSLESLPVTIRIDPVGAFPFFGGGVGGDVVKSKYNLLYVIAARCG